MGTLRSQKDSQLNYAIRIVEARPYWRMPGAKHHVIEGGLFLPAHRPIGTLPAERLRLPTPEATWKLTGRTGRLSNGTIVAGFGAYLYWSHDEGGSWDGRWITDLPQTAGPVNLRAFGVSEDRLFLAYDLTSLPRIDIPNRETYPSHVAGLPALEDPSSEHLLGRRWKSYCVDAGRHARCGARCRQSYR